MWFEKLFIFANTETISLWIFSLVLIYLAYAFFDSAQNLKNILLQKLLPPFIIWVTLMLLMMIWGNIFGLKNINIYEKLDNKISNLK
ncbi:MAG: hypothetical protein ACD_49C00083G0006 [uncultured bacterium (gcode 4)]|uniref:Uncharacterized protein n=1 Tax=uncultured bacterium (gcode 4) TaxID=1234023 RepID=K2BUA9_9BACT|nr:MAG: hypothetical protein ACD_49C00083G0006 [uncultured bacterium (gcode 4)]